MKQRQHNPNSRTAHEFIKPHKPSHVEKIVQGLIKLRVGGNFEAIAAAAGLTDSQTWKRISEMIRDNIIYNTGTTKPLKSGMQGAVYQLCDLSQIPSPKPSEISFTPTVNIQQSLFQ